MRNCEISFSAAGGTCIGIRRQNNEDNFQIGSYYKKKCSKAADSFEINFVRRCRYTVFAVFDGIGGGPYGEYASLYAAEELYNMHMKLRDDFSQERVSCMISDAFQSANNRIIRSSCNILGTTAAVCMLDRKEKAVKYFWSGDSRGYLYRNRALLQITQDQSVAALSVQQGFYQKTDAGYQADKNRLTGYIGKDTYGYQFHPCETSWIKLNPGDMIFLMTDGIFSACSDLKMQAEIQNGKDRFAVDNLIRLAGDSGSPDDRSIVQIKIEFWRNEENREKNDRFDQCTGTKTKFRAES